MLNSQQLQQLIDMSLEGFPNSSLVKLGPTFLYRFFHFVDTCPHEQLVYETNTNKEITKFALISLSPQDFLSRLLKYKPLLFSILIRFWRLPVTHILFGKVTVVNIENIPEVILICVLSEERGKGYGSQFLKQIEKDLLNHGVTSYCVKTENNKENRAIPFYLQNGFTKWSPARLNGTDFIYLRKNIFYN